MGLYRGVRLRGSRVGVGEVACPSDIHDFLLLFFFFFFFPHFSQKKKNKKKNVFKISYHSYERTNQFPHPTSNFASSTSQPLTHRIGGPFTG